MNLPKQLSLFRSSLPISVPSPQHPNPFNKMQSNRQSTENGQC